jgi:hypothetical protein
LNIFVVFSALRAQRVSLPTNLGAQTTRGAAETGKGIDGNGKGLRRLVQDLAALEVWTDAVAGMKLESAYREPIGCVLEPPCEVPHRE